MTRKESGIDMSFDDLLSVNFSPVSSSRPRFPPKRRITLRVNHRQQLDKQQSDAEDSVPPLASSGSSAPVRMRWTSGTGSGVAVKRSTPTSPPDVSPTAWSLNDFEDNFTMVQPSQCRAAGLPSFSQYNSVNSQHFFTARTTLEYVHPTGLDLDSQGGDATSLTGDLVDNIASPLSVGHSSTTNSASEVDDLLANIKELEPLELNDDDLGAIDPNLPDISHELKNFSFSGLGGDDPHQTIDFDKHSVVSKCSSSCPPSLLRPPSTGAYRGGRRKEKPPVQMTDEQRKLWDKERIKKDNHNIIEKRRRYKINDCIQMLARLLPRKYDLDTQNKKGTILCATVDYVRYLQKEEARQVQLGETIESLKISNDLLIAQMQKYREADAEMQVILVRERVMQPQPVDQIEQTVEHTEYLQEQSTCPQQHSNAVDFTSEDNVYALFNAIDSVEPDPTVDHGGNTGHDMGIGWANIKLCPSEENLNSFTEATGYYACGKDGENMLMDCGFDNHFTSSSFEQLEDDPSQIIQPDYIFSDLLPSGDYASSLPFEY